jgi:hypothetical protein
MTPTQEGVARSKPGVIEGVTAGLNSPRDDHVSNTRTPQQGGRRRPLYKELAVAPKGLAYATPELTPLPEPNIGLKRGYRLGARGRGAAGKVAPPPAVPMPSKEAVSKASAP